MLAVPRPRDSDTAASRSASRPLARRSRSRSAGPSRRAAATAAAKASSAGMSRRSAGVPLPPQPRAVRSALPERDGDDDDGGDGEHVEHAHSATGRIQTPTRPRGGRPTTPRPHRGDGDPCPRQALSRSTEPTGAHRAPRGDAATAMPAHHPSACRDRHAAVSTPVSRPELPAPRAAQLEAPPRALEIASQGGGREHCEREQQRSRLAADQQQPATGDAAGPLRIPQLLDRRGHLEGERRRLQLRTRAVDTARQLVDLHRRGRPGRSGRTHA